MATVRDLIKDSLREIHALGRGQDLQPEEASTALDVLNRMLAYWSIKGGLVYTETLESFPATGATSYSMGTGGDFDTDRPVKILAAYAVLGTTSFPLELIDDNSYASIADKTTTGQPDALYSDGNYPLSNLYFHPLPPAGWTLNIISEKLLTSYSSLSTTVNLAPGYELAIQKNLAIMLAPHYEKVASQDLKDTAEDALDAVFAANTPVRS